MTMARETFLVDVMLIKLGRWLRVLGYDCRIPDPEDRIEVRDRNLADAAIKEGRILLTMDRELSRMAGSSGAKAVLIPSDLSHIKKQLKFLFKNSILDPGILCSISFLETNTRCTTCGAELEVVNKEDFEKVRKMPGWIRGRHSQVWVCKSCKQIYWKGSHWRKIIKTLEELKEEFLT